MSSARKLSIRKADSVSKLSMCGSTTFSVQKRFSAREYAIGKEVKIE
jgi:hypothetical protein